MTGIDALADDLGDDLNHLLTMLIIALPQPAAFDQRPVALGVHEPKQGTMVFHEIADGFASPAKLLFQGTAGSGMPAQQVAHLVESGNSGLEEEVVLAGEVFIDCALPTSAASATASRVISWYWPLRKRLPAAAMMRLFLSLPIFRGFRYRLTSQSTIVFYHAAGASQGKMSRSADGGT